MTLSNYISSNERRLNPIDLSPGEEVCPRCKGMKGIYLVFPGSLRRCPLCKGKGKVDWIQKAIGV